MENNEYDNLTADEYLKKWLADPNNKVHTTSELRNHVDARYSGPDKHNFKIEVCKKLGSIERAESMKNAVKQGSNPSERLLNRTLGTKNDADT